MVKYVEMTLDEAIKYCDGKGKVLVATKDLKDPDDTIQHFSCKSEEECKELIKEAQTIVNLYDEFVNQIRLFTYRQPDIMNILPVGKMNTVLFHRRE